MPTKPVTANKIKKKKNNNINHLPHTNSKLPHVGAFILVKTKRREIIKTGLLPPVPANHSIGFRDKKRKKNRKKSRLIQRLLSLSFIVYLGYYFFYGCEPLPSDDNNKNLLKPVICKGIDPIKADIYQSKFYKENMNPTIIQASNWFQQQYHNQVALQKVVKKIDYYYIQHAKSLVHQMVTKVHYYADQVMKIIVPVIQPYTEQLKLSTQHIEDYIQQAIEKQHLMSKVQETLVYLLEEQVPPPVKKALKQNYYIVLEWIDKAENTDIRTFLAYLEHTITNFYQQQLIPHYINPFRKEMKRHYDELHLREFMDKHIIPAFQKIYDCAAPYYDVLYEQIRLYLPPLSIQQKSLQKSSSSPLKSLQTSTISTLPQLKPSIIETLVTPSTIPVALSKQVSSTNPAYSSPTLSSTIIDSNIESEKGTTFASSSQHHPEATINKYNAKHHRTDDSDIITRSSNNNKKTTLSSINSSDTPKADYQYIHLSPPDPNEKEVIYCPTCNPVEEQIMIAVPESEKEMRPLVVNDDDEKEVFKLNKGDGQLTNVVNVDKEVQQLVDKKEVFEVHREQKVIVPPQSPIKQKVEKEEDTLPFMTKIKNQVNNEEELKTLTANNVVAEESIRDSPDDKQENKEPIMIEAVVGKNNLKIRLPVEEEGSNFDEETILDHKISDTEEGKEEEEGGEEEENKAPIIPDDESQFIIIKEDNEDVKPTINKDGLNYDQVEKILT
ncbi:uncharacterized protein BX663DRAFT_483680 [Cokeromyces recurvatus]|uniref:uncharacterized protein n=1 Tax=Cokeromyces recurvatus TaxID=90255 RepID=UPI00221F9622|nr:uncharacterized protein BX663DRAFT_483680 [Cokeromyces recurvatus]KAI7906024.1 hypothetical protein BX663DRAFT_483680 [Cokeromyces recurvatus]